MISPAPRPSVVCFDLGGVLVRLCNGWPEAYRAAGLEVRELPSSPSAEARRRELVLLLDQGAIALDEWAEGISRLMGAVYSPDEMKRVHFAFIQGEYAGAPRLVDDLHAAGVVTACLSNTNAAHWCRFMHADDGVPRAGVPEFPSVARLKHRLASHVVGAVKPSPEIYEHLERSTGARGPEIVFFDDRQENVEAAIHRGWQSELVDPFGDPVGQARRWLQGAGVLPA